MKIILTLFGAAIWIALLLPNSAQSQEPGTKSSEQYLAEAAPVLHLSCAGVITAHGDDDDAILNIVEKMTAVSLINRGIDVTTLKLDEADLAEIRSEFADQLGDACAEDADALLAGIVDRVVAEIIQYY